MNEEITALDVELERNNVLISINEGLLRTEDVERACKIYRSLAEKDYTQSKLNQEIQ